MSDRQERRWISVNECAARTGRHPMTIRDYIDRGLIPATRLGRSVLIDWRSLEATLEQGAAARIRRRP